MESPFAKTEFYSEENHIAYARRCCYDCATRGEIPFASHLFFPQFFQEATQRDLGIDAGYVFWGLSDKIAFYVDYGISPGMKKALIRALTIGKIIERRVIGMD